MVKGNGYSLKVIGYWLLVIVLLSPLTSHLSPLFADETKKPSFLIEDNTFFDPTKKVAAEEYHFGVEYRIEVGYVQHFQRTHRLSYPNVYLDGASIGASFTFLLPLHFSLQTGLHYTLAYGTYTQHWRSMTQQTTQTEFIAHRLLEHQLTIPVRAYYTVPLWRKLNMLFYTGMNLHIGVAETDKMRKNLSYNTETWLQGLGIPTESYDRMKEERWRANTQWSLGVGLEWDRYRLQGSYDFGLNNLVRHPGPTKRYMSEWGWTIGFCVRIN